jgi:uncharacterized membrane protein YgdD (TMEM256/DUF423 family)
MPKLWLILAGVNGFLAVAAGAFAAHGLQKRMSAEAVGIFETAARYQMYHALALLAVGWLARTAPGPAVAVAGWAFTLGIVLFSGSLYALCVTGLRKLGMITPIGGTAFLVGWLALVWAAARLGR